MPLFCDVLASLNDAGALSVKQIEDALGLARRSGYRLLSGSVPDVQQFRQLFRSARSESVQRALLGYLIDGTGWVAQRLEADRDIDGDGVVSTDDVFDGAIEANGSIADLLRDAKKRLATGARRITPEVAAKLNAEISRAIKELLAVQQAALFLSESPRRSS